MLNKLIEIFDDVHCCRRLKIFTSYAAV